MKLKVGDKVKLITSFYGCGSRNPVWGGVFGKIIGTVGKINCYPLSVRVDWDNHNINYYNEQDLSLIYEQLNLFSKEDD